MDKRKKLLIAIAIIIVLVSSIPFPGLYALWGFLAFAWLAGRIKTDDTKDDLLKEGKSE
jgi:energy-coupling factor transporter transmembrane protein EcfT